MSAHGNIQQAGSAYENLLPDPDGIHHPRLPDLGAPWPEEEQEERTYRSLAEKQEDRS